MFSLKHDCPLSSWRAPARENPLAFLEQAMLEALEEKGALEVREIATAVGRRSTALMVTARRLARRGRVELFRTPNRKAVANSQASKTVWAVRLNY